ncbi:MAG: class I SAM-dependent methyltransferase [Elusimicrobiota bacterium]
MIRSEEVDYTPFENYLGKPRPCAVCGASDKKESWARSGVFHAVRCRGCGLVWIDPFLTEAGFAKYYTDYIAFRLKNKKKMEQRSRMYELDGDFLRLFVQRGELLDVGCSAGFFLEKLGDGFSKHGIEKDPAAVALARERNPAIGAVIQEGELGKDDLIPGSYDVITMRGVIEHLPDPRMAVRRVAELLRPDGWYYVTATPNTDSFCAEAYREKWNQFDPIQHIYCFSAKTLGRLCGEFGLKLEAQAYPYLETPYASPEEDYAQLRRDLQLIQQGRRNEVGRSPAFWGNMMTLIFRKNA